MKRYIKIFSVFMITLLFVIGTVACSKTSEGEKDMTQKEREQLKEEIKSELKEEMQTEAPAQNVEQEAPVTEQSNSVESAPTLTEQPSVEQPSTEQPTQPDKTEHSDMPVNDYKYTEDDSVWGPF